jgi:predicted ATP-dependent endonuclease of OLD family
MQGVFRQAQIWNDRDKLFKITPKTSKRLKDASQLLTDRIRAEWQQGKDLIFHLIHAGNEGDRIKLSIEDPSVRDVFVNPSQRSTGFSTFFGMSMALFARKEASPANNYIFVFDEPATALHPHGQVNIQRVFETLARKNQITFTTHSVFMINKNFPTRNRVIEKTPAGTLIDHKPYLGNWKAVRSNLGLVFTNNFFVADTTLLVEGPSDVVYISSLLRTLNRLGEIDVDLNLFSTLDAGNTADMVAMAKIAADEGRRVVVLVDGDTGNALKKKFDALNDSLPAEVKIDLYMLAKNESIEDRVLYPGVLREALVRAAEELVTSNIRQFKAGVTAETIKESLDADLAKHKKFTLGKAIVEVTKGWFDEDEPLSKLQIARHYDDLVEAKGADVATAPKKPDLVSAKEVASELNSRLGLQRKMADETITEPV